MDQATLVREQVDGGEKLVTRLTASGVDVSAAFWAKTDEDGQWYLYIVTRLVDDLGPLDAYGRLADVEKSMGGVWSHPLERIDRFGVKLISPNHPLARGVLDEYRRYPGPSPTWHGGSILGSVFVEGAYIYPPTLFQPPTPSA